MEIETEDILLQKCRTQIENRLGWGPSESWATHDYELLSRKIQEATTVNLSIATLKRIWGKIRYDSKPTITTLNTLAQYLGFENWRAFSQQNRGVNGNGHAQTANGQPHPSAVKIPPRSNKKIALFFILGVVVFGVSGLAYWIVNRTPTPNVIDPLKFEFSSKKVVDEGVPNTVIFDYDASAAGKDDTVFIQQSWDKRLRQRVPYDAHQHASIYYYPGFFQAKLVVNEKVVKEHNLFIKTAGWISCIEQQPVPVYYKEEDFHKGGILGLTIDQVKSSNVPLQPSPPWVSYYNVRDFGKVFSNDFIFETEVRNDYREGSAVCQHTQILVLMEGAAMVLPLSIPGCVSELNVMGMDGKKSDLTALGVDFSSWVKVRFEFREKFADVFINEKKAFRFNATMGPAKVIGIAYRFQGTGSINYSRLTTGAGEVMYEDAF